MSATEAHVEHVTVVPAWAVELGGCRFRVSRKTVLSVEVPAGHRLRRESLWRDGGPLRLTIEPDCAQD